MPSEIPVAYCVDTRTCLHTGKLTNKLFRNSATGQIVPAVSQEAANQIVEIYTCKPEDEPTH